MDETWGYHYQEVVLQGYISDFVWVGLVRELGGLENGPTTHSWRIPGLGIYPILAFRFDLFIFSQILLGGLCKRMVLSHF
jgi:hypothetical protein